VAIVVRANVDVAAVAQLIDPDPAIVALGLG
jgi:hypothetical protein